MNVDDKNDMDDTSARKIESIDITDFAICLSGFDEEVEDALKQAIKKIPEEERDSVIKRKWAEDVTAELEGGLHCECIDSFVNGYSMDNNPEMLVVNYENGDDETYGKYMSDEWPEHFNEIEGDTYVSSPCNCMMRYASYDSVTIRFVPNLQSLKPEDEVKLQKPFDINKLSYVLEKVTIDLNEEEYEIRTSISYDGIPFVPEEVLDMSDWNEMEYYIYVGNKVYTFLG